MESEETFMTIMELMKAKGFNKYRLYKQSGLPKTTILDICNGHTSPANCAALTIYRIALTLDITVEEFLMLDDVYDKDGTPINQRYPLDKKNKKKTK